MKFIIKDKMKGRLRVHMCQNHMSYEEADILLYYLESFEPVSSAKVYDRTADAVICYTGNPDIIIDRLRRFHYEDVKVPNGYLERSGRETNAMYQEKLVDKIIFHYARKWLLPYPISAAYAGLMSVKYIWKGVKTLTKGKIEVPVLDATSIGVSVLRGDMKTAGSIMFLLGIGELLEEWTHKKSVDDLARTMSLNVGKVWLKTENNEILVDSDTIAKGDHVVVNVGTIIPFDGTVCDGEAMVNQASLTGESVSVRRTAGNVVYAGTVVEEGSLIIEVKEVSGSSRYEKIAQMIDESEKLKSNLEGKAEHLADRLVPYSLGGTILTYLLTRNVTKALAILMVDYSCALKLAMPVSVLSAIREAGNRKITVKGGKYLEAVAEADTIVFDKTGTLTKGVFKVVETCANGISEDDLLELAAYGEYYSNHPIAASIKAAYKGTVQIDRLDGYEEISGMGIKVLKDGKEVLVGNKKLLDSRKISMAGAKQPSKVGTVLFVAENGAYKGCITIADEIKDGVKDAIASIKKCGIDNVVMLTGDKKEVADSVAKELGIDTVCAELMPGDKVDKVEQLLREKDEDSTLIFTGDGINDAPVLMRADVGIAMGAMGQDAAIEAADIVLIDDDPGKIAVAYAIARKTVRIVQQNIVFALAVKIIVMVLGALGFANMWAAVFADVGVAFLAIINATRALKP